MFEELGKLGTVEKVRIYDRHPEGVIWVQFADSLVASKCIEKMRGRWYNGARIIADLWDYKRDFKAESILCITRASARLVSLGSVASATGQGVGLGLGLCWCSWCGCSCRCCW